MKAALVSAEGEDCYDLNSRSQTCAARKQAWTNQGLEREQVFMEKVTYASIPETMTSVTNRATVSGSPEQKQ